MLGSNVYGLNITIAWPLPSQYRTAYEEMAQHVAALDRGLYVYPFAQTHVTVITAVSFKHQINPCAGVIRLITDAAERLGDFVRLTTHSITPFVIDIAPPVLTRNAAFLPIFNPTGEIFRLRQDALDFCAKGGDILAQAHAPQAIHSTILRFREVPREPEVFLNAFEVITGRIRFGRATINEILITFETNAYMHAGTIAETILLKT